MFLSTCRYIKPITLFALLFISGIYTNAQQLNFRHYSVKDGLPNNEVRCIVKDKRGFMWIGTDDGLCRFDGNEFLIYKNDPSGKNSICGNLINKLAIDKDGYLWIATTDGLCRLNTATNYFTKYAVINKETGASKYINEVIVDSSGTVFIALDKGGVWELVKGEKEFRQLPLPGYASAISVNSLAFSKGSDLFTTPLGGGLLYSRNNQWRQIRDQSGKFPYPAHTVNIIYVENENTVWLGAWDNALHKVDLTTGKIESYPIDNSNTINYSGDEIITIQSFSDNELWIGTHYGGLLFFDKTTKKFRKYSSVFANSQLRDCKVRSIYKDNENRMWVGSGNGLYVYDPLLNQFTVHLPGKAADKKNIINDCLEDENGALWLGADKGLYHREKGEEDFELIPVNYKNTDLKVTKLLIDNYGHFYVGTTKTLFLFDCSKRTFKPIKCVDKYPNLDLEDLTGSRINAMAEINYRNEKVVLASVYGYGCLAINPATLTCRFINVYTGNKLENLVRKFVVSPDGSLNICGASYGWIQYLQLRSDSAESKNMSLEELLQNKFMVSLIGETLKEKSMKEINAYDAFVTKTTIWLTSPGIGLIKVLNDSIEHCNNAGNSLQSAMQGIFVSDSASIWIIESNTLEKYNPSTRKFIRFDENDGIPDDGVSGYFHQLKNKDLLVLGRGYFVQFNPQKIHLNVNSSPVYFTHLTVEGKDADSLLTKKDLTFSPTQNFFTLQFASIDYTSANKIRYEYKMEGANDNWISNGARNYLTFINLRPGSYHLHVRAVNSHGIVNKNELLMSLFILAPWYRQYWFFALIIVVVGLFIYALYSYRMAELRRMQLVRNRIARDLHDDIGSALGSISFYSESAGMQLEENNTRQARNVIGKIGETSREMIGNMHDIVWAVNPLNDSIEKLFERMRSYATDLTVPQHIEINFTLDTKLNSLKLGMDERKNIFLIFKEAIFNCVKYSGTKQLDISISQYSSSKIKMIIRDYGKGLPGSGITGNGLRNMKQRADELKAKLEIKSDDGVEITLIL